MTKKSAKKPQKKTMHRHDGDNKSITIGSFKVEGTLCMNVCMYV